MVLWYIGVRNDTEKWVDQSRILTEISFIQDSIKKELQSATKVEIQENAIIASYLTGAQVRFYLKDHKLIRTVRQPDETLFRGTTVLSNQVQEMNLQLNGNKLSMMLTFISKTDSDTRQELLIAWGSQGLLK